MSQLFDVVAVKIKAPHDRRVMATGLTTERAEDFIKIAVWRRGVNEEFYTTQPSALDRAQHGQK